MMDAPLPRIPMRGPYDCWMTPAIPGETREEYSARVFGRKPQEPKAKKKPKPKAADAVFTRLLQNLQCVARDFKQPDDPRRRRFESYVFGMLISHVSVGRVVLSYDELTDIKEFG